MWEEFKKEYRQAKRLRHLMLATTFISFMLPLTIFFFFQDSMATAGKWLMGFMLVLLCVVSFIEANTQGIKDKRTAVSTKVYPLKGFVLGVLQQLPFIILTVILLVTQKWILNPKIFTPAFRSLAPSVCVLQFTDILLLFDYSWLGYLVSFLVLPVVCEIGYALAYFGRIDIDDALGGIRKT